MSELSIDRPTAKKVYGLINGTLSPNEAVPDKEYERESYRGSNRENRLDAIDILIGSHGVEAIEAYNIPNNAYWFNTCAIYCNTGDTYNATILYCTQKDRFYLTTFGDYVERNTERYQIK